jgi:hypothetical protein
MMAWNFKLNGKPKSALTCGPSSFPAFSGMNNYRNDLRHQCVAGNGPIPAGTYYILQRESGGRLGWLRELWSGNNKKDWFALYAADEKIDDEIFCDKVKRGAFRLHPKGPLGISEGCITIESSADFITISHMLKSSTLEQVPNSEILAYGKVTVA